MSELRDFSEFYSSWQLPEAGVAVAEAARNSPPTRDVSAGSVSVSGITTMRHNGTSIPFESRTPEYFFYTYLNISDDCLEVRPQPPARKITYQNADGRRVTVWRTHDALCFRERGPAYVECKNEKQLLELEAKAPDLFTRDETGRWISPACARDAESIGFAFEVFCPDRYDVTFVRNADFLFNYLWRAPSEEYVEDIQRVCAHVQLEMSTPK